MLAVKVLSSLVEMGLVVEMLPSVDILEVLLSAVVLGRVVEILSVDVLGLVVDTISSVVLLLVVDSPVDVVTMMSVVLRGKLVVVRPGSRAHIEA